MAAKGSRIYSYPLILVVLIGFAVFVHVWLNRYATRRMKLLTYVELGDRDAVDYILSWDPDQLDRRNSYLRLDIDWESPPDERLQFTPIEYTPLGMAVAAGQAEIVEVLLKAGADPNAISRPVGGPLHLASKGGRIGIARQLLEHGAKINGRDAMGKGCLYHAVAGGHVEMFKFLLNQGAPINQVGEREDMLLEASERGFVDLVRLLLKAGANPSCVNGSGDTPLHLAAAYDHIDVAKLLVKGGAKVEPLRRGGMTPLHWATAKNSTEVALFLLAKGSRPSLADDEGWSPLHYAATNNNIRIVSKLIELGANVNARNGDGRKPLDYARGESAKLLKAKGATKSKSSIDNLLDDFDGE